MFILYFPRPKITIKGVDATVENKAIVSAEYLASFLMNR